MESQEEAFADRSESSLGPLMRASGLRPAAAGLAGGSAKIMRMTDFESKGYKFFEQETEVGLAATGASLSELFTHAAQGLAARLVGDSPIASQDTRAIQLRASSVEELLVAWLTELLQWFATDRFVPAVYHLDEAGRTELHGRIIGETFNPDRHVAGTNVKGVTRRRVAVVETPEGWDARVVFDV